MTEIVREATATLNLEQRPRWFFLFVAWIRPPALVAQLGIGVQSAAQLLVTAGDNPQRLRSEGSFAHLCCNESCGVSLERAGQAGGGPGGTFGGSIGTFGPS